MRILVINDNADFLALCRHMLESRGHEVEATTEASTVSAAVTRFEPDAIVLDWMLEDRTGGDVLEQLQRSLAPLPPVLVMSSLDIEREAKRLGAQAFLRKPFLGEELETVIKALVQGESTG